eukprot:Anaeramoba_flamelloidesa87600_49.p1 GENE.a87600_49~~a87600_49.p1  ORF type:complete len:406 (-),score=37.64 a87600_49:130-1347(-)
MTKATGRYGLPLEVKYCKRCTLSNQEPKTVVTFKQKADDIKPFMELADDGICDACKFTEKKNNIIDWEERELELIELCNTHRRTDGRFDCIVPGSGGKDSVMAAHLLKYKYNMHPLTITWAPFMYTEIGKHNFDSWLDAGFPNYTYTPNTQVHKILTQYAFRELVHPFQMFIVGQKNLAPKLSKLFDIPLVFYGENEAEYGHQTDKKEKPTMSPEHYSAEYQIDDIRLGGHNAKEIMDKHKLKLSDIDAYLPISPYDIENVGTEVHYLGYYLKWHPQEVYYFSVENTDFMPNMARTEGSYSKYRSLDDKMDWLHWYTYHAKFGMGRTTFDTSQEIRNEEITREEGISLIKRFDGEYPEVYIKEILEYLDVSKEEFDDIIDGARPDHLWEKENGIWKLKQPIWEEK